MEQAETLAEAARAAEAASVAASLAAAAAVEAEAAVAAAAEGAAAAAAKVEEEGEDEGKRKEPAQSPPPPPPPLPPPCVFPPGIINGGAAVCYFNAALQALASAEPLVDFLGASAAAAAAAVSPSSSASSASSSASSASSPSSSASSDLLMEASALLSALSPNLWKGESNECGRNSTSPPLSSAPLLAALRAASPAAESSLRPNRQQDSVEAAQLLLEAVSVAAAANATGRGGGSGEGQGRGAAAAVAATASREGRDRGLAAFCSPSSLPPLSRWASSSPSAHSASVNPCAGTVISESACVKCRSARPSEVTPFTVLPLPLPPLRRRDSSPSSPPSSRGFVSSLEAALLSFTGTEPLMSGLECGRCTLVRVIREAQGEAAEAEATGRPPPRWRQQNMSDGGGGGGDATRNEFLELLQLAFGERSPFPVDVEVQAERARRVGLPWDRTVSRAAAAAAAGAGAGAVGAAAAEAAAAAAAENASSPFPSPSTSTRPSAPPPPPLPRETAVRRATLARCPRVLCLQLLRALGPGDEGKRKEPAQSPPPPPPPLPPPCVFPPGIINGGAAVCYFNAALQALASAEPLVDFLGASAAAAAAAVSPSSSASSASSSASSASSPSSSASSDLLMEASALLSALSPNLWKGESNECGRNSTSPPLSSAPLLAALRAASPAAESSLRPNRQQDSVEAAQLLLEAVSVAAAANATGRGGGSGEGQGRGAAAAVAATASREGRDRGLAAFCSPSSLPPLSRWASSSPSAHSASVNPCAGTVISESACVKCRSARPSEVTPFTVLPLPLPPLRRRDSSPSSPPSSRGFVSSLEAALLSFTGTEPLMSGLECGRCTLVRVIREAQGEAAEAEATGRPPPRWRQQNMSDGGGGGGDATRNEFLELLQLAFGERSPFPVDVEVQAERARRVGLPWDRTVSRAAAAAAAGAGAGAVGAAAAEAAAAAAAENASSPFPSPSTSTRPSAPPPPPLPRETAVRRATLARCPRVLCLQLLRALGPGDKLRGGVDFGLVVDVARFTAAGAGPLLPSWRAREEKEERKREEEEEEEEEAERRRRRRPRVSGAEAETSGAAPLRRFIVPLSEPPGPRQLPPPEKAQGPIYLLSAVVAHTGSGTSRGHYICYRRFRGPSPPSSPSSSPPGGGDGDSGDASPSPCAPSPSPSSPPSSTYWCGCSDLRVWRASDEEVRGCEAVMLVYCRQ